MGQIEQMTDLVRHGPARAGSRNDRAGQASRMLRTAVGCSVRCQHEEDRDLGWSDPARQIEQLDLILGQWSRRLA